MKIGLALRELHRAETALTRELLRLSDRHHAEHEIHHVARDLAGWSQCHAARLADAARGYDVHLRSEAPQTSGLLGPLRTTLSDLTRGRDEPGLLLLADLRRLHRRIAGVPLDWELLAQGAQAVKDGELLDLATACHPRTLRHLAWSNAMLKTLSPQVLTS
ncbi:hypothetical protein LWP59_22510 [Amycolatopsis acidiphila]|uniref:DUF892 family protein n=1 Tax=Amycolatopsis acidiphila TaxID=715473 RepID=A0A558A3C3_9PSEU|nr:hypothetical protein [Amycolatopsis acidiphila]TVT18749.1 hypothetical protein FNH06_26530 [Amycolatopsis acidiphila]UIJ56934.1 hypothetical protein LWP59_22510 [Amycolatopsis acidiphila]